MPGFITQLRENFTTNSEKKIQKLREQLAWKGVGWGEIGLPLVDIEVN